ncbi:MAG: hypothetical protein V4560_05970 [Bacteroidota bacterium]
MATQFSENIKNDQKFTGNNTIIGSGLPFYDITVVEKPKVSLASGQYSLNRENLDSEIGNIMNRERLFYISQAYEVLESYLYNQVTQLIISNDNFQMFVDASGKSSFTTIRKALKGFSNRQYNQHLTSILRANCELYAQYESSNIYNIDFKDWFKLLGVVRNCVVHNRSEVTKEVKKDLPISYLNRFTIVRHGAKDYLHINFGHSSQLLLAIANYMFFVHKSITKRCYNIDLDVLSIKEIFPEFKFIRHIDGRVELI